MNNHSMITIKSIMNGALTRCTRLIGMHLGELDLSLQPIGKKAKIGEAEATILQLLKEANGTLPFTYKSDAEAIQKVFGMSKKNFKSTLTELIQSKQIQLLDDSITLL